MQAEEEEEVVVVHVELAPPSQSLSTKDDPASLPATVPWPATESEEDVQHYRINDGMASSEE